MIIDLYINNSEQERISKTLTSRLQLDGTLRAETSVINPTVIIEAQNPSIYNYMHIPLFHRYYYITDITSVRDDLWRVSGKVDVLMSYESELQNVPVIVADSKDTVEKYMSGNQWQTSVKTKTDIISFPNGLNSTGEYILITSGGLPTTTE